MDKHLEIRANIVGRQVFSVAINSQSLDDWRSRDVQELEHRQHELPPALSTKLVELVSGLGLTFGAVDLILTPAGDYVFLELNPNGEWGWLTATLDDQIQRAIAQELTAQFCG